MSFLRSKIVAVSNSVKTIGLYIAHKIPLRSINGPLSASKPLSKSLGVNSACPLKSADLAWLTQLRAVFMAGFMSDFFGRNPFFIMLVRHKKRDYSAGQRAGLEPAALKDYAWFL